MRTKSTPVKVVEEDIEPNKEVKKKVKKMSGKGVRKKKANKKVKTSQLQNNTKSLFDLVKLVRPFSIILTRCDDNKYLNKDLLKKKPKKESPNSTTTKQKNGKDFVGSISKRFSSRILQFQKRKKAQRKKSSTGKFFVQKVPKIPKKRTNARLPVSKPSTVGKQTNAQVFKYSNKKYKPRKIGQARKTGVYIFGSKKIAQLEMVIKEKFNISSSRNDCNERNKAASDGGPFNFEHLIHNYAKPCNQHLYNKLLQNVSSESTENTSVNEFDELPLSQICEICGRGFRVDLFLKGIVTETQQSHFRPRPQNMLHILSPRDFNTFSFLCPTTKSGKTEIGTYTHCSHCPMMYLRLENLQNHQQIHSVQHHVSQICKYCFQVFDTKESVRIHVLQLHPDENFLQLHELYSRGSTFSNDGSKQDSFKESEEDDPAFLNWHRNQKRPPKFSINVPKIMLASMKHGVKMITDGSYTSYIFYGKSNKQKDKENSLSFCDESDADTEWQSYLNTNYTHNYPTEEHNYAFIPPTNKTPDTEGIINGIPDNIFPYDPVKSPLYSNVSSHYLDDDGLSFRNQIPDISHVEEVEHDDDDDVKSEEDYCISLSPDIVKYISQDSNEEDQNFFSHENMPLESNLTQPAKIYCQKPIENQVVMRVPLDNLLKDGDIISGIDHLLTQRHTDGCNDNRIAGYTGLENKEVKTSVNNTKELGAMPFSEALVNKRVPLHSTGFLENKSNIPSLEHMICEICNKSLNPEHTSISNRCTCKNTAVNITCNKCGHVFYSRERFSNHRVQICSPNFKCKLCQQPFTNKDALIKHMPSHLRWLCGMCSMIFKTEKAYLVHKDDVHRKQNTLEVPVEKKDITKNMESRAAENKLSGSKTNKNEVQVAQNIKNRNEGRNVDQVEQPKNGGLDDQKVKSKSIRKCYSSKQLKSTRHIKELPETSTSHHSNLEKSSTQFDPDQHTEKDSSKSRTVPSDNLTESSLSPNSGIVKKTDLSCISKEREAVPESLIVESYFVSKTPPNLKELNYDYGPFESKDCSNKKQNREKQHSVDSCSEDVSKSKKDVLSEGQSVKKPCKPHIKFKPKKKKALSREVEEDERRRNKIVGGSLDTLETRITNENLRVTNPANRILTDNDEFDRISKACLRADGRHHCDLCNCSFTTVLSFKEHRNTSHLFVGNIKCPLCPASFDMRTKYRSHMNLHSSEEAVICATCSWVFYAVENLISHFILRHTMSGTRRSSRHVCVFSFHSHFHNNKEMILYKCKDCGLSYLQRH